MTATQLQAGREMDVLVAERVMRRVACDEWKPINFGSAGGPAWRKQCKHDDCYSAREQGSLYGSVGGAPKYSTDIAAAWQVVEKLRADGWVIKLEVWPEAWNWAYVGREDESPWESKDPNSMPSAICRAALAAVGEPQP